MRTDPIEVALSWGSPHPGGLVPYCCPLGWAYLCEGCLSCPLDLGWPGCGVAAAGSMAPLLAALSYCPASSPSSQLGPRRLSSPPGPRSHAWLGGGQDFILSPAAGRQREGWLYFKLLSGSAGTQRPLSL